MQVDWFRTYSPGTPTELHGRKMFRVSSSSSSPSPVSPPHQPVGSPLARVPPGSPISRSSNHTASQFFKSNPTSSLPRGPERAGECSVLLQTCRSPKSHGSRHAWNARRTSARCRVRLHRRWANVLQPRHGTPPFCFVCFALSRRSAFLSALLLSLVTCV